MSWSYSGDPASSDLDAVRFIIGDTISADPQLSNEEILYLLDREGSVFAAAAAAVRGVIARYARLVDKSVGDLQISYSQRLAAYRALLAQIEEQQAIRTAGLVVGGISRARKRTVENDGDRVAPSFERDQFNRDRSQDDPRRTDCWE
jgi:hypothetical protein